MDWMIKLEARSGWGEVETIELARFKRRVVGLTAEEVGLSLAEGKELLAEVQRLMLHDPDGRICGVQAGLSGLPEAAPAARLPDTDHPDAVWHGGGGCAADQHLPLSEHDGVLRSVVLAARTSTAEPLQARAAPRPG